MVDRRVWVNFVSSLQILEDTASLCNYYELFLVCVKSLLMELILYNGNRELS